MLTINRQGTHRKCGWTPIASGVNFTWIALGEQPADVEVAYESKANPCFEDNSVPEYDFHVYLTPAAMLDGLAGLVDHLESLQLHGVAGRIDGESASNEAEQLQHLVATIQEYRRMLLRLLLIADPEDSDTN